MIGSLSQHKSNTNFVKIPSNNLKTLLPNTQVIWAVPSSFTKLTEDSLKEIAKQRIMERFEIPESQTFDESMKVRQSCHLIEQINDEFFCDCLPGSALKILMKLKSTYNFVRGPSLKGGGWIYLTGEGCWTSRGE